MRKTIHASCYHYWAYFFIYFGSFLHGSRCYLFPVQDAHHLSCENVTKKNHHANRHTASERVLDVCFRMSSQGRGLTKQVQRGQRLSDWSEQIRSHTIRNYCKYRISRISLKLTLFFCRRRKDSRRCFFSYLEERRGNDANLDSALCKSYRKRVVGLPRNTLSSGVLSCDKTMNSSSSESLIGLTFRFDSVGRLCLVCLSSVFGSAYLRNFNYNVIQCHTVDY